MNYLSKTFLRGILALLPLILTLYPLYYFFDWLNTISNRLVQIVYPDIEVLQGTGIILGVVIIFILGLLMSSGPIRKLFGLIEIPFKNIPIVKSLYTAIKELTVFLAPDENKKKNSKVVLIKHPASDVEIIGFLTQSNSSELPVEKNKDERVAIYIPMSYQIGGFTFFLPKSWLREIDLSVEDAMKYVLTGWMTTK